MSVSFNMFSQRTWIFFQFAYNGTGLTYNYESKMLFIHKQFLI